jgi:hypothetical protein
VSDRLAAVMAAKAPSTPVAQNPAPPISVAPPTPSVTPISTPPTGTLTGTLGNPNVTPTLAARPPLISSFR